jgi:4-hydroxy-tetrahydrodipicolinate reductase
MELMALKVGVHGAAGRMGRTVVQLVSEAADLTLACAIDAPGSLAIGRDAGELAGVGTLNVAVSGSVEAIANADVVIDFSLPSAIDPLFDAASRHRVPLVLATTGLSEDQWRSLDALAAEVPLIAAPNYSTGVAVLYHLAEQASRLLREYDLEIVEMHHRLRVDAPSGTALGLGAAAARGRQQALREHAVFGREGQVGPRADDEIGIMTLRGGDVIGDHTLIIAGAGERLELTHKATNRGLFAHGALRAARWLTGKAAGRYGMNHVLGL